MLHRVVFGSVDRFIGILIEHYAGKFPIWLSPVQVKLLPVSDKFLAYAKKVEKELRQSGVRVSLDDRDEKLGFKIREARLERVPFIAVVGKKEQESETISIRVRDEAPEKQDLGQMRPEDFIDIVLKGEKE